MYPCVRYSNRASQRRLPLVFVGRPECEGSKSVARIIALAPTLVVRRASALTDVANGEPFGYFVSHGSEDT